MSPLKVVTHMNRKGYLHRNKSQCIIYTPTNAIRLLSIQEQQYGIDVQKKCSLSYALDKEKNCYIQMDGKFCTYTRNCEQKATIGIVKSTLKIPPEHNGILPVKIKVQSITEHMAYFISNQDSTKGKDPNINIVNGIHNIKGKHLSIFWFQITATNTSCLTKENM